MLSIRRFRCGQIKDNCKMCGDCCIRYPLAIDKDDEDSLKKKIYASKGVLYIYPFSRFGLPFIPEEVKKFIKIARQKKIKFRFKPLKVIIKNKRPVIIDFFLDMESCPFLMNNRCSIYEDRFRICRAFPDREKYQNTFSFDYDKNMNYEDAQMISNTLLKHTNIYKLMTFTIEYRQKIRQKKKIRTN